MSERTVAEAAARLQAGGLVAFPTETVYGLGGDASSPTAVARIFATKGRPSFNPLIAHVATLDQAAREGVFTPEALKLAERFWPGPLTLVLARPANCSVCDLACAGLASVGLRVPSHPVAQQLLRLADRPIAAPSANRSGRLSPTRAEDVSADLQDRVDMILDGGPCTVGIESSIVACLGEEVALLRTGGIARDQIESTIGRRLSDPGLTVRAPGMLTSHYAPSASLRLEASELRTGEVGLGFAGRLPGARLDLSACGDLREAAAALYSHLRRLDALNARIIAVASVPDEGLGAAINDRLRRAAAPRPAST